MGKPCLREVRNSPGTQLVLESGQKPGEPDSKPCALGPVLDSLQGHVLCPSGREVVKVVRNSPVLCMALIIPYAD